MPRKMLYFVKWQDNVLSVGDDLVGKTFPFKIGEHWSGKKELEMSPFPWNSTSY